MDKSHQNEREEKIPPGRDREILAESHGVRTEEVKSYTSRCSRR